MSAALLIARFECKKSRTTSQGLSAASRFETQRSQACADCVNLSALQRSHGAEVDQRVGAAMLLSVRPGETVWADPTIRPTLRGEPGRELRAVELGLSRDRPLKVRKSGKPDLRASVSKDEAATDRGYPMTPRACC